MLNWALMKHPVNWLTITLMVIIGLIALNLILTPWHADVSINGVSDASKPLPDLATVQ
jgi:hypothetical protein